MFDDVDEALRRLLVQEIPIRNNEIEIAFDQPRREWSARLNRPSLNVFLYDVRENTSLRPNHQQQWRRDPSQRTVTVKRPEVRVDLHYMITAWAAEPDDEHRLLARTLIGLLRHPELPAEFLPSGLRNQPRAVGMEVAQYDASLNPTEIWGVLDNELRPALTCMLTVTVDPHQPFTVPAVRTRELRLSHLDVSPAANGRASRPQPIYQSPTGGAQAKEPHETIGESEQFWSVGGVVQPAEVQTAEGALAVRVVELDRSVPVAADGRFVVGNLRAGAYTLELIRGEERLRRQIQVPSEGYDFTEGDEAGL